LGGLGIGMRTQQFAASMALLSEGNMTRIEIDIDAENDEHKALASVGRGRGDTIRLTIESSADLDVAAIDPASLRVGPGRAVRIGGGGAYPGVRRTGEASRLTVYFSAADARFGCRDDAATLIGSTYDGRSIAGLVYLESGACGSFGRGR